MFEILLDAGLYALLVALVFAFLALMTTLARRAHAIWLANVSTAFSAVSLVLTLTAIILNAFGAA
jgi:hypothetical protein